MPSHGCRRCPGHVRYSRQLSHQCHGLSSCLGQVNIVQVAQAERSVSACVVVDLDSRCTDLLDVRNHKSQIRSRNKQGARNTQDWDLFWGGWGVEPRVVRILARRQSSWLRGGVKSRNRVPRRLGNAPASIRIRQDTGTLTFVGLFVDSPKAGGRLAARDTFYQQLAVTES
jgi:hypothetical protein